MYTSHTSCLQLLHYTSLHSLGELVDVPIATLLVEVAVKKIQTLP